MPKVNLTLDDCSPLITFGQGWLANSDPARKSDPMSNRYFRSTFMGTNIPNAMATFEFEGTGVWVYGAKRDNHADYVMSLDGAEETGDGMLAGQGVYQTLLWGKGGLDGSTKHTLNIINSPSNVANATSDGKKWLDVDYIIYEAQVGADNLPMASVRIDDSSERITYTGGPWQTDFSVTPQFYAQTGHLSANTGDSLSFSFEGEAVTVYGGVNNNHGPYTASLDGGPEIGYDGHRPLMQVGVPLYQAANLANSSHTIVIKNTGTASNLKIFDIDFIEYNYTMADGSTAPPPSGAIPSNTGTDIMATDTGVATNTEDPPSNSLTGLVMANPSSVGPVSSISATADAANGGHSSSNNAKNIGMIAGAAVAGVAALGLVIYILYLFRKRSKKDPEPDHWQEKHMVDLNDDSYGGSKGGYSPYSDGGSTAFWGSPGTYSIGPNRTPATHAYLNHDSPFLGNVPRGAVQHPGGPYLSQFPQAPPSNNPSFLPYPYSVEPSSDFADPESPQDQSQTHVSSNVLPSFIINNPSHSNPSDRARSGPYSQGSEPSIGEVRVGRAMLVNTQRMNSDEERHRLSLHIPYDYPTMPDPARIYDSPNSTLNSTMNSTMMTGMSSPHTRAVQAVRDKADRFNAVLPPTSLPSAVTSEDLTTRMRVVGRAVDAGPAVPVTPSTAANSELPPDYVQATEPLPGQRERSPQALSPPRRDMI